MPKTPKLKTTLRKAPAKQDVQDNPDVTSESSEAVSSNPWATEASLKSPDSLSRQVSKASAATPEASSENVIARESDNASEKSAATAATHQSQPLEPTTNGSFLVPGADDAPKAKRKKTISKTPHTFELQDELKNQQQQQQAAGMTDPPKEAATALPMNPKSKKTKAKLSFSPLRTTLNLYPIDPPPPSPVRTRSTTEPIPNNPFSAAPKQHRKSSSKVNGNAPLSASIRQPYRFIPASQPLDPNSFFNKVVVITHGSSLISASLIRQFHAAGARVIFGDQTPDKARKIISRLGPPDIVNYNHCDVTKYEDILALFKLAVTMYGRVDHAIFGIGDDGGAGSGVGEAEKLWGLDFGSKGRNKTGKEVLAEVETEKDQEGVKLADITNAGMRFARIAIAYLKHTPKGAKSKRRTTVNGSTDEPAPKVDRSLTFLTSTASFKGVPNLMVYQAACHNILGIVRSFSSSINLERDEVRINAVLTNVMIPTAKTMIGGRMSVQLPVGRVEDAARVVAGVVGDGSVMSSEGGGGVHGKVLYVVGEEAVDIEDGLRRSEKVWMGDKGKEGLERAEDGWTGDGVEWMLMDGMD